MPINWNLGVMPDVGQNALAAFEQGREQRKQDEYKNAIQTYAGDPSDQNLNALLPYAKPEQVFQITAERQKRQAQVEDDRHAATLKGMGQAALDIMSRPPEQRAAAWDAYAQHFARFDPSAAQSVGQYNEQAVMAILAQNGLMGEFQKSLEPKYQVVPEGGALVDTHNPEALARFSSQPPQQDGQVQTVTDRASYDALPPGASYRAPDGSLRRKGGPTPQASGGFRP